MIQKITKGLLVVIAMSFCTSIFAQDGTYYTVRDLESWTSAQFKYKPSKKWTISFQEQLRLKDNSSTVSEFFTQGSIKRNLENKFSVGLGLRYIRENDNEGKVQGYENHLRWNADLGYKHSLERFKLKYRLRYQSKNEMGTNDIATKTIRLKAAVGYNIKNWKLDPEVSGEFFSRTNSISEPVKYRLTIGTIQTWAFFSLTVQKKSINNQNSQLKKRMKNRIFKITIALFTLLAIGSCKKQVFIPDGEVNEGLASHNNGFPTNYDIVFEQNKVHRIDIVFTADEWEDMQEDLADKTAGGGGPGGTFSSENPDYFPADIYYNDLVWRDVGVRYKGNSSIRARSGKLPLRFDFDEFEDENPAISNQRFYGFKELSMSSNYNDASLVRESTADNMFREFGVPAVRTAYYEIWIDEGSKFWNKWIYA